MNKKNLNGSFNITVNNMPYNTIQGDKYYNETLKLFNSNPELFEIEEEQKIDLEEIKFLKINDLKNQISNEIYEVYPLSKQIDILGRISGYTDENFEEMKIFIEEKINKYKNEKEKI